MKLDLKCKNIGAVKKIGLCTVILVLLLCTGCNNMMEAMTSKSTPTSAPTEIPATSTPTPTEVPKDPTPIFYLELVDNDMELNGQYVEVIIPINNVYGKNQLRAEDELEYCLNAYINRDLTEQEKKAKYAKVQGTVDSTTSGNYWNMHNIKDCTLVETYNKAPKSFKKQLTAYKEAKEKADKEAFEDAREDFIEKAKDDVSYDDLRRYPDTYKGTALKLKIKVLEVEADSWLSNGSIIAEYGGKQIIIHDEREVREPRLLEGDKVTIYVKGDGLTKIKEYIAGTGLLGTSLGADVVDEYEVPAVELMYVGDFS